MTWRNRNRYRNRNINNNNVFQNVIFIYTDTYQLIDEYINK